MTEPLWQLAELASITGGRLDGADTGAVEGFSIDTRTLTSGDVFVALMDQRDGHTFVGQAFGAGAVAALVCRDYQRSAGDGTLLRVDDPLRALEQIAAAARQRLSASARVFAVTGSAGKTGTKEMLRQALQAIAPGAVHASIKSYNNHWGVPLMLASMPAATRHAVFEIGMNHAGEIAPLTRLVRPHVAIVTNVLPVHVGNFADGEAGIAAAKAEIFAGLEPGGTAVLPGDSAHRQRLEAAARAAGARLVTFGLVSGVSIASVARIADDGGTTVTAHIGDRSIRFRVGMPGAHIADNALAVVAALDAIGADLDAALAPLANLAAPQGRGARQQLSVGGKPFLLIDESYNANPASMRAAIATAGDAARRSGRLVLVLGDMLELGEAAADYHKGLAGTVGATHGVVFACGPNMLELYENLPADQRGRWAATSVDLEPLVLDAIEADDVVMVKGSLGSRMGRIVDAIKKRFA